MKILVLGARGFTGRHLMASLRLRRDVTALDARDYGLDLLEPATLPAAISKAEPDMVVNLAAIATPTSTEVPRMYETNAFGHLRLMEALKAANFAGRYIFASSANVYGHRRDPVLQETMAPQPANHYGCSKALAEHFCAMNAWPFEVRITRPFNCIGVGQAEIYLVPKIIRHFREKQPVITLGNTAIERDFVDIRDAVAMYETVMFAEQPAPLTNFATNQSRSIQSIVEAMQEISGHRITVERDQSLIRPNDLLHQCGDNARIRQLGWQQAYPFRETLEWMYGSLC